MSLSSKSLKLAPAPTQPPNQKLLDAIWSGVGRPGHQADNLPPSTEEVKHEWRYLATYAIQNPAMDKGTFIITKKTKHDQSIISCRLVE